VAVRNSGTDASLGSIRRENLPASIAAELRRRIQHGELEAGDRLPGHRELAAAFAVSVGSVREAISMLISEGLIETRAGLGTFVANGGGPAAPGRSGRPLSRKEAEELVEAREVIEVEIAALAARRALPEQVARLEIAAERLEAAAASPRAYADADVEFHLALAEAAGNRYLLGALGDVRALLIEDMELAAEVGIRQFGSLGFSVDSHHQLVEAIASHDVERARGVVAAMVRCNRAAVLGLYALGPPAAGDDE
jgi:GntR family transcriptional regulator, transcriptional repressor for pyruvate dehydrogenase complex